MAIYHVKACYNEITKYGEGDYMIEALSIIALLSLYKYLDTSSEPKEVTMDDYYMDESEYYK
jgi:hypothetical protein